MTLRDLSRQTEVLDAEFTVALINGKDILKLVETVFSEMERNELVKEESVNIFYLKLLSEIKDLWIEKGGK
jgi:hypothetical protein